MNPLHLLPDNAPDFISAQKLEQHQRCTWLTLHQVKTEAFISATANEAMPPEAKQRRLEFLRTQLELLHIQHHDAHRCWPFSRN